MSYQLDLFMLIKAYCTPADDWFYILVVSGVLLSFPVLAHFKYRKRTIAYRVTVTLATYAIIFIVVLAFTIFDVGAGWLVKDNELIIDAPPVNVAIDIPKSNIALIEATDSWMPSLRVNGTGTPGASYGRFKLQNGKNAVVFRHLNNKQLVLVDYDGVYYIIIHPGVEKLYKELINIGANNLEL